MTIFVGAPFISWAQQEDPPRAQVVTDDAPRAIIVDENSQAAGARSGGTTGTGSQGNIGQATKGAGKCAISSLLSSGIKKMIASSKIGGSMESPTQTPTNPVPLTGKEVGLTTMGGVSWDAIGYCLINTIIEYIGTATVQWINSGFKGNPVFVENPERFFMDIADIEAGNFLNELSGGYLCSPLRAPVRINLARYYNGSISPYSQRARCTFTGISGSLEQFMSGQSFSWQDWLSYTEPQNNPYGATILGQMELDQRIANAVKTESTLLEWGRGFLSPRDENNNITSPGAIIEERINDRLGSGERRIEMADEFDEIVNALVNQLIVIALDKIGEAVSGDNDSSGSGGYNYNYDDYFNQQNNRNNDTNNGVPIVSGNSVLLCRFDLQDGTEYEYDYRCFPSRWMQYTYSGIADLPIYASLCELPSTVDPNSAEARERYYNGECIPPTIQNIQYYNRILYGEY